MAKRKQNAKDDDEGGVLFIRLPEAVQDALSRMISEDPLRPKKQEVGLKAILTLLETNGYWPPPKK